MSNAIILIPAYEPNEKLLNLIIELQEKEFYQIIVVDDGSDLAYEPIFNQVKELGCNLIQHKKNLGKGAALKTGIRESLGLFKNEKNQGIITVDCDGQHQVMDIININHALMENSSDLILGVREFNLGKMPLKSYLGNKITSAIFKFTTGIICEDTQTGLRGIPKCLLENALKVEGSRYEYEYNFLQEVSTRHSLVMVPIETIYLENNKNSHFRPVQDSLLVYQRIIKFGFSSLASFGADILFFYLMLLMTTVFRGENIILSTIVARILSGTLNFFMNKKLVFKDEDRTYKSGGKYCILFIVIMWVSAFATNGAVMLVSNAVLAKVLVDIPLFLFSYIMQKYWVFSQETTLYQKSKIWKSCATLFFICYVGFTLLNRFVVPQNIVLLDNSVNEEEFRVVYENIELESDIHPSSIEDNTTAIISPIITENSYYDGNMEVTINAIREYETDIYIAEVIITESDYLQAGLAKNSFGTNVKEKTSVIAENNQAILAINGDYYGFRDEGYVMRNGYLYREIASRGGNEDLVIYADGSMEIIQESEIRATELAEKGAVQIFSFGPGLIEDGEIIVDENSKVDREDASNPRTAIGMIEPNHYIFMVSDGRTNESAGLTVEEMAIILEAYGCQVAYNLDGGGSSTMVFLGEVINNPTSNGREFKERSVSDIVYIGE